jgi:hypothetical protein
MKDLTPIEYSHYAIYKFCGVRVGNHYTSIIYKWNLDILTKFGKPFILRKSKGPSMGPCEMPNLISSHLEADNYVYTFYFHFIIRHLSIVENYSTSYCKTFQILQLLLYIEGNISLSSACLSLLIKLHSFKTQPSLKQVHFYMYLNYYFLTMLSFLLLSLISPCPLKL